MATPPNSASSVRAPKAMSSRLLTMKFMQRAAASGPTTSSPSTPTSLPPTKRQKFTSSSSISPAIKHEDPPRSDLEIIQAALEAEERKRQEAVERLGEERGEGRWVFSFVEDGVNGGDEGDGGKGGMKVQGVGWGDIDGGDGGGAGATGRRSWGRFNRVVEKRQIGMNNEDENTSSSSSSEGEGEEDSSQDRNEVSADKVVRKARRKEKKAETARQAERRKSKVVKLNKLSAISGGGGGSGKKDVECYRCGEVGHRKSECEKVGAEKRRGGEMRR